MAGMALLRDEPAVHLRDDGLVRVTGRERLAYLHLQLSQHLAQAQPGTAADFLYLDAKGGPLAAGRAVVHAEAVLLVVPRAVAAPFTEALERFKFMMAVVAEDVSDDWVVASIRGPGEVSAPGARSAPMTAAPHGPGLVVRDRSGGVDLLGPRAWVEEKAADLGLPLASSQEWEAWRIAAGVPAWGPEIAPGRRPQELGLLPTHVHLAKGCYPGQEVIAKMSNLGTPRRALAVVAGAAPLTAGAAIEGGPRPGEVTSAAGGLALALVPLDRDGEVPPAAWTAAGVPLEVRTLVGAGLPQPGRGERQPAP